MATVLIPIALIAATVVPAAAGAPEPSAWIELGAGSSGDFRWFVRAEHQSGPPGAAPLGTQRPCLTAKTMWRVDLFTYYRSRNRECVDTTERLSASEAPLIVSGAQPSSGAPVERTAIGMVLAPAARRVQVTFCNGSARTIRLDRLSPSQAGRAKLVRFRYAAFAVHGEWCADRLRSQDATGRTLWDSDEEVDEAAAGGQPVS